MKNYYECTENFLKIAVNSPLASQLKRQLCIIADWNELIKSGNGKLK